MTCVLCQGLVLMEDEGRFDDGCVHHKDCMEQRLRLFSRRKKLALACPMHCCIKCFKPGATQIAMPTEDGKYNCACLVHPGCEVTFCFEHTCRHCKQPLGAKTHERMTCSCALHDDCQPKIQAPICGTHCRYCSFGLSNMDYRFWTRGFATLSSFGTSRSHLFSKELLFTTIKPSELPKEQAKQLLKDLDDSDDELESIPCVLQDQYAAVTTDELKEMGMTVGDFLHCSYEYEDMQALGLTWNFMIKHMRLQKQHFLQPPFRDFGKIGMLPFSKKKERASGDDWVDKLGLTPLYLWNNQVPLREIVPFNFKTFHFYRHGFRVAQFMTADLDKFEWQRYFGLASSDFGMGNFDFSVDEFNALMAKDPTFAVNYRAPNPAPTRLDQGTPTPDPISTLGQISLFNTRGLWVDNGLESLD